MTILDFIGVWWLSLSKLLEANGVTGKFERSPIDRPNPSCSLNLRRGDLEVDLLVWASGEAELATVAPDGSITQKHFDDVRQGAALGEALSSAANLALPAQNHRRTSPQKGQKGQKGQKEQRYSSEP